MKFSPSLLRRSSTQVEPGSSEDSKEETSQQPENPETPSHFRDSVTQLAATLTLPLAMLIAAAHILYAGVNPGDGFTAGVIAGLAVALWFIVFGYKRTKERLRWLHPVPIIASGLFLAFGNALLPLLLNRSFLTLTILNEFSFAGIKFASSLVYEVGIFLAVAGSIGAIMEAISHPQEVEPI